MVSMISRSLHPKMKRSLRFISRSGNRGVFPRALHHGRGLTVTTTTTTLGRSWPRPMLYVRDFHAAPPLFLSIPLSPFERAEQDSPITSEDSPPFSQQQAPTTTASSKQDSPITSEDSPPVSQQQAPTTTASSSSSSTQQTTTEQVWRQLSDQLLLSLSQQHDKETTAEEVHRWSECIRWWTRQRPITLTSQEYVWKLWDRRRSLGSFNDNPGSGMAVDNEIWLAVADHWRLAIVEQGLPPYRTPEQVWDEIQSRLPPVLDDDGDDVQAAVKSHGILLDVLSRSDRPEDAERLLLSSMTANSNHDPRRSIVLWNTVLTAWARSQHPDATERAVALFHRMPVTDKISVASVLEALANGLASSSSTNSNGGGDWINKVEEIFSRAAEEGKVSEVAWLQRLQAWGAFDMDKAKALLYSLRQEYLTKSQYNNDEKSVIGSMITPNHQLFTAVMSAYAKTGDSHTVRQLWDDLQELHSRYATNQQTEDSSPFRPTPATLSSVLLSLGRAVVPDRAEKTQALLEFAMDNAPHVVDRTAFNCVMDAWAGSLNRQHIEAIQNLLDYMKQSGGPLQPDTYTFNALLKGLSRSDRRDALEFSRKVLKDMWNAHLTGSEIVKPNHVSYSTILFAYSRLAKPDDLGDAEALFEEVWKEHYQQNDPDLLPSEATYVSLITTWIRSKRKEAPSRSAYYFDHMRAKYAQTGNPRFQPSVRIYNTLIDSHKLSGDGPGAEQVLRRMIDDYRKGNAKAEPTTVSFNTVMTVYMKSNDRRAPKRIEKILFEMERLARTEGWSCYPNTWTYTIVLEAWSSLRSQIGAERAEAIFRGLQRHYQATQDANINPNNHCYVTCMNAWSKSGSPDAPERATALFYEMMEKFESGDDKMKPGGPAYTTLLSTWSRSMRQDAPARALAILNEMTDRHRSNPDSCDRPNAFHYSTVINAFAEQGDVENAEAVFDRVLKSRGVNPNRACWNGVLKAHARSPSKDSPERASQLLNGMYARAEKGLGEWSPDAAVYTTLLEVWRSSGRHDAFHEGIRLLDEMLEKAKTRKQLKPDAGIFLVLLRLLGESEIQDKALHVKRLVGVMKQQNVRPDQAIEDAIAKCR